MKAREGSGLMRSTKTMGWVIGLAGLTQVAMAPRGCNWLDFIQGRSDHDGDHGDGHGQKHGCVVDGERHAVGERFPAGDGCNTCTCGRGGEVACTLRACLPTCGGLAGLTCPDDQFCSFPPDALCGAADAMGVCEEKPEACTREFVPVCGCDGETYANACEAAAEGVSIAEEGECEGSDPPAECGGIAGLECRRGEFCNFPPEARCGAGDATGLCEARPQICTLEFNPVCGCDEETYANACEAAAAGVAVAFEGECEEQDD